jgi:aspartate carbamoyltransferase regulatory subunit
MLMVEQESNIPLSKIITSSEIQNVVICEAIDCISKATNKIAVKVAPDGRSIFLFLCDNCKPKFCTDLG